MPTPLDFALLLVLLFTLIVFSWIKPSKLPPGPKGLPFFGNMLQISRTRPWKQFQEWHKTYGPIFCIKLGQMNVVIIGNHEDAKELLGKRSLLYSSPLRSDLIESIAKDLIPSFLPYGEKWHQSRRIRMTLLSPGTCGRYYPAQDLESTHLLFNLLYTNNFRGELHRFSSSLMSMILYSKRLQNIDDPGVNQLVETATDLVRNASPMASLADLFPVLRYLPSVLDKRNTMSNNIHNRLAELFETNLNDALNEDQWNLSKHIFQADTCSFSRKYLAFLLGELFMAGANTVPAALCVAIAACVCYPDAMRRAQTELDQIVGWDRLPVLGDIPNLHYIQAFVKELFRWRPLGAFGMPRSAARDDWYKGHFIPKGTTVMINSWSLQMDEEMFPCAEEFRPERWLEDANLPASFFGFGRRACPGEHFSRSSVTLVVSRILWAFDIKQKQGQETGPDFLDLKFHGLGLQLPPFEVDFAPRSSIRKTVIVKRWENVQNGSERVLGIIKDSFL